MRLHEVIVVDDSEVDRQHARAVLERYQVAASIFTFGTGIDALEFLQCPQGHDVDVILLDRDMPEMDGFEFLQAHDRLHEIQRARAVVLMLASAPAPANQHHAFGFGSFKHYVVKPLDALQARSLVAIGARSQDTRWT